MTFRVLLTDDAARDLEEIHSYVSEQDSELAAGQLLDRVGALMDELSELPDRGSYPSELLALGIQEYRQAILGPYRVIYRRVDDAVYVYVIADGRRDMHALLARRLLRG